jgi:hypothetical protein
VAQQVPLQREIRVRQTRRLLQTSANAPANLTQAD